jgi:PIN domain
MARLQHSTVEEIFNLIVDTNILLHQLDALQQFVVDIEHHLPFTLQIIVPGIVISELDRCVYFNYLYLHASDKRSWTDRRHEMIR